MKHHNGFTLIELMISLTLGLLLTVVVLQLFFQNKQSYRVAQNVAQLQESAQFLRLHLADTIRLSGYRSAGTGQVALPSIDSVYPIGTPYVFATNGLGQNGSDTLTVRYQGSGNGAGAPDGTIFDCLNFPLDSGDMSTNLFFINAELDFVCQAQNETTGLTDTQVLASNIENFKVLLGEDLDGDNNADRYVSGDYVGLDVRHITSVRLSFLIRTKSEVTNVTDSNQYNLLGLNYNPADDRRIRRVFSQTIQLRNIQYDPT